MTAALLLLLALPARSAPLPALQEGSALFFRGDRAGAVDRWKAAREGGGSRAFDALLSSALTALGKQDLAKGRFESAHVRFSEALAIDPHNRTLRELSLTSELAAQTGGLRTLRAEETDATEEMDRLLTALLLLDRPAPGAAPARPAPARTPAPAAARGEAVSEKKRAEALALYERGLESYYAGAYDKALSQFYEASHDDPGLEKAYRAVVLVTGAVRRRDAQKRYQEALRAFYAGDTRKARAKLQEVLMLDPGDVKARGMLEHLDAPAPPSKEP